MPDFKQWRTERISHAVLCAIVAVAVVVFALFRLVGYDTPYFDNPDLNAPLLTGMLVGFMLLLVLAALAAVAWAAVSGARKNRGGARVVNGIHAARLSRLVAAFTLLALVVGFASGSTKPVSVNGAAYTDSFWLRTADMFVNASLLLIVEAVAVVAFGATRYARKKGRRGASCS